ncbi:CEP95 protein, partial [Pitta sordida]|nr:CEP95 protein [Pitta sordida]
DWVDVANGLLRSCHIDQHIKHLSECGAEVFVRLYESILGEKVPDLIATPRSQEDDAHNVQAVIDSLALDYLQVSLSHITGENIVRGEKESIRNLLEIFDGLLEYLTEVSESSSHAGVETNLLYSNETQTAAQEQLEGDSDQLTQHSILSAAGGSQSQYFAVTCDTDVSECTEELIRLGDTARSFSKREEGWMEAVDATEPHTEGLSASATKLGEPIQQAIPLLPPFQPSDPGWRDQPSSDRQAAAWARSHRVKIPTSPSKKSDDVSGYLPLSRQIPVGAQVGADGAEDTGRKVSLVHEPSTSASSSHEELSLPAEQFTQTPAPESRYLPGTMRQVHGYEKSTTDSLEESLSQGTTKKQLLEQELHETSKKLSHRLNQVDLMLKRALGEHSKELPDEDSLSQHSDSVMDYGQRTAERDTSHPRLPGRPRSLSPPSPRHQENGTRKLCGDGQIKTIRRQLQRERDDRARKAKMVTKAYEDELRTYEAKERLRLSKLREAIREIVGYKENIFKEPPKMSQPVKVCSRKTTPRAPKSSQWIPKRGTVRPKKAAPMTIRDNDLLLKLLEEFPYLHLSHHALHRMWQQQLAHTEHLKAAPGRTRPNLQHEVHQTLRKYELLAAIMKKDQDHRRRLQEFKQRIQRQKWAQNKVTEKRQQAARARKYYEEYRVQLRAKLLRHRTREERIFKNLFEEGLEIQKQRLRDLRAYAQEKRDEQQREHQNELEAMENYYKDQFAMLAEALSQEFQEIKTREKAQAQMLQKSKRELRSKMEKEIQQLQAAIMQNDDDTFFQELEADRLRSRLQLASFQYSHGQF